MAQKQIIYTHNSNIYVKELDKTYALFLSSADSLIIDTPIRILHRVEDIFEEILQEGVDIEIAYVYRLHYGEVNYDSDIWNSKLDSVDDLRDMFVGIEYNEGDIHRDALKDITYIRVNGKWVPVNGV